jgi:pantoate--beta-alanine ligase
VNPELLQHTDPLRSALAACRSKGDEVGIVLTMGSLHAGHMSLIRRAAAECGVVVVTVYVNPLQFGPDEDLSTYPRDLQRDLALAGEAGASFVFAPSTNELWPEPPVTTISVGELGRRLEGEHRPGHFEGVATIVAKLLSLIGPGTAYFGEKDFQQLLVVRKMVQDLSIPVVIVGCPVVREPDGLAFSSRNTYLTPGERQAAPKLYYALLAGKRAIEEEGVTDPAQVEKAMEAVLAAQPDFELDYATVAYPGDLSRPELIDGEVRLLAAARLGRARLIDNVAAEPPEHTDCAESHTGHAERPQTLTKSTTFKPENCPKELSAGAA